MKTNRFLRPVARRFEQARRFSQIRKEMIGIASTTQVKDVLSFSRSCKGSIYCVNRELPVLTCAEVLTQANIAALLVVDKDKGCFTEGSQLHDLKRNDVVGIVGERDIARTKIQGGKVEEIMSTNLITVSNKTTVGDAMEAMLENNIRHLPVFEGDDLVGFLSMKDVLHACAYREGEGAQAMRARSERR